MNEWPMASNNIFKPVTIPLRSRADGPSLRDIAFKEWVLTDYGANHEDWNKRR